MWFLYHSSLAANPIREHAVSYPSTPKLSMHGSCLQWAVNTFSAPTPLWGESGSKCRLKSHLCKYLFFTRSIFKGTVFKIVYMYNKITLPLMQEVQTWWELLFFFFLYLKLPPVSPRLIQNVQVSHLKLYQMHTSETDPITGVWHQEAIEARVSCATAVMCEHKSLLWLLL